MSKGHTVLKWMRKVHLYLGIFTTPALLFFAFTGAMQTFSLHETTPGSSYKPPAWIATLAQLHKKQDTTVPVHKLRPAEGAKQGSEKQGEMPGEAREHGGKSADGMNDDRPPATAPGGPADGNKAGALAPQKSHLPMKIFFLLVAMSLALSTLTGVYMSFKYNRGWWMLTSLLVAGLAAPLLLLRF